MPSWHHLVGGAPHALRVQAVRGATPRGDTAGHNDSWGVGWFDDAGTVSLVRQVGSAADSAFYVFAAESAARGGAGSGPAQTVIGHLRKASCGAVTSENAHPVRVDYPAKSDPLRPCETLLVAHNGTLREPLLARLRADIVDSFSNEARSDSDTVVLAGWLASRATGGAVLFDALATALRDLFVGAENAYTGLNLLIGHASGLYALRQFTTLPDYYTLLARPGRPSEGASWIVASEPTDNEKTWEPLAPGELVYFAGNGAVHTARVAAAD